MQYLYTMKKYYLLLILTISFGKKSFSNHTENDSLSYELKQKMSFDKKNISILKSELFQFSDFEQNKKITTRKYLQSISITNGYSASTNRSINYLTVYSDTSNNVITMYQPSPVISFTHNIALSNIFSLSYSLGYQKSKLDFNRKEFSNFKFFAFINPRLITLTRKRISFYSQLKIGIVYEDLQVELLKSRAMTYFLPPHFKVYTGFTPFGLMIKLTDRLNLNSELSIWSFESINIGLNYSFSKNDDFIPSDF